MSDPYDDVPYDIHPFPQTHPSRLAAVATLFGLDPPPVDHCRVLELGCAHGGNLLPLAEAFPHATFVGVDASARQVADADRTARAANLSNVTLRHADILDIDAGYGLFDTVLCHGVFSWVPEPVRRKILDVCAAHLTPNGVAYVSYNTYPGWHLRGAVRDMMRYHAARFADPRERIGQARALLDFLAQASANDTGPYGTLLRTELGRVRELSDSYLYHEHLEAVNDPLYFHQFAELAARHGLRYLGEARVGTMVATNFTPDVRKGVEALAADPVQTEQYLDFVRNRTFRESLLVRADAAPDWAIRPDAVRRLHVGLAHRPDGDATDFSPKTTARYRTPSGLTISTSRPALKAAMRVLGAAWPGTAPFAELEAGVAGLLGAADAGLAAVVLNTYLASDLLELHAAAVPAVRVGERPAALAVARARLAAGEDGAATRRHEFYRATDLDRHLIPLLDGTRDRAALVDRMAGVGGFRVEQDGRPVTDPAARRAALGRMVDEALDRYAEVGLLTG
ncbi:MAG: hypothetical protein C0501_19335 [Isosphaera sp.]|nr:hypothetical protein [Isosphaera sp.]